MLPTSGLGRFTLAFPRWNIVLCKLFLDSVSLLRADGLMFIQMRSLVLPLVVDARGKEMQAEVAEGRTCLSQSHMFHGYCVRSSNCKQICQTERFLTGGCLHTHLGNRRCFCEKPYSMHQHLARGILFQGQRVPGLEELQERSFRAREIAEAPSL